MNKLTRYEPFTNSFVDSEALQKERASQSIFVSIVCYEDENIFETLESLYNNALIPERLYVSVVFASRAHLVSSLPDLPYYPNLQPTLAYVDKASGVSSDSTELNSNYNTYGKLKNLANKKFNGETFYMTVGSSTRFDPNWEDILLKYYQSISKVTGSKIVLTAFPRAFLNHEQVVEGFNYYMNHKQQVALQREAYDGATVPHTGFPDGYGSFEAIDALEGVQENEQFKKFFFEFSEQQNFLEERGYPRLFGKKFNRGEVIHMATGVSHDFLFGKAREVLKINPSSENTLDIHAENMLGSLRFFKEGYVAYTLRWTPVYKLYDKPWMLNTSNTKSILDDFSSHLTEEQLNHFEIINLINELKSSDDEDLKFRFNTFFGIDWESNIYKIKTHHLYDALSALINTMTTAYDFSINENSLHWNKRS